MDILIRLYSKLFTGDQDMEMYDNKIRVKWDIPIIPRIGEGFCVESIIENIPSFADGLGWTVDWVDYEKVNGVIIPVIHLNGE